MFNPLTCSGWDTTAGWFASGGCLSGRIGFVILFFVIAIMRKWVFGLTGIGYNFVISIVAGMLTYLIALIFIGAFKWALLIGLIVSIVAGVAGAAFMGETDNS